ncbi:MAG: HD domain-containing protein [Thaumarchaeota archaeon]|nr:HD domain-containing protein [Nitrososphaerota archaeon]
MAVQFASKKDLISVIENEAKLRVDSFVEGALSMAEEVHSDVKREDGVSPFLESHIWPVTIDVIRHYLSANKPLTTLQIVSSILHDVMEDNDKILDPYASKSYGSDAYFIHRFGDYVYKVATTLKVKPLDSFSGNTDEEREDERFRQYCGTLAKSDYDVKVIKLADRINNMRFISKIPYHEKVKRYIREAEDFFIAFSLTPPRMDDFYEKIRQAYTELKNLNEKKDEIVVENTN